MMRHKSQCPHCGVMQLSKDATMVHLNENGIEYDDLGYADQLVVDGIIITNSYSKIRDYCALTVVLTDHVPNNAGELICMVCRTSCFGDAPP